MEKNTNKTQALSPRLHSLLADTETYFTNQNAFQKRLSITMERDSSGGVQGKEWFILNEGILESLREEETL